MNYYFVLLFVQSSVPLFVRSVQGAGADITSDILLGLSFGVEVRSDVGNRREQYNGKETVSSQSVGRRSFEQAFVSFELLW